VEGSCEHDDQPSVLTAFQEGLGFTILYSHHIMLASTTDVKLSCIVIAGIVLRMCKPSALESNVCCRVFKDGFRIETT
jgi:hypothetical protein